MKILNIISLFLIIIFAASCEYEKIEYMTETPVVIDPDVVISFTTDIKPTFDADNCSACHNGSYKFVLTAAELNAKGMVDVTTPANSKLLILLNNKNTNHTAVSVSSDFKAKVEKWIKDGAKANK